MTEYTNCWCLRFEINYVHSESGIHVDIHMDIFITFIQWQNWVLCSDTVVSNLCFMTNYRMVCNCVIDGSQLCYQMVHNCVISWVLSAISQMKTKDLWHCGTVHKLVICSLYIGEEVALKSLGTTVLMHLILQMNSL